MPLRSRFRLRVSLRLLLAIVLMLSIGFAWFANWRTRVLSEHAAARKLEKLGGVVMHSRSKWAIRLFGYGDFAKQRESPVSWLPAEYCVVLDGYRNSKRNSLGQFEYWPITDEMVELIRLQPHLEQLTLDGPRPIAVDLSPLRDLPQLRWLTLMCDPSDAETATFSNQQNLRQLGLAGQAITKRSLFLLAQNPHLEDLRLSSPRFTDDDLKVIGQQTQLKKLALWGCPVTSAGIEHLTTLQNLETLQLGGTLVDDNVVPALQKMPGLRLIDLQNTAVTAKGREQLQGKSGLRAVR